MGKLDDIRGQITDRFSGVTRSLARSGRRDFGDEAANQAIGGEFAAIQAELLQRVRDQAKANGEQPNLEAYRKACVEFSKSERGQKLGTKWNPNSYANLGGQDLSGFKISDPTLRNPSGKRATTDLMDQDGDHAVSDFYTNISFFEANLNNAYVDPATSFNDEVAKAAQLNGITFNGMKTGDKFVFGAGEYNNVKLTGIEGGDVVFAKGSKTDGIELEGKCASVTVEEGASIEHIKANKHFSTIRFDTQKGSRIANCDLTSVNISGASTIEGCEFNNVQFGPSLKWLEFKEGCVLKNVSVDGKPVESAADLLKYGAESVHPSVTMQVSAEFRKQCAMDMIRKSESSIRAAGAIIGKAERSVLDPGAVMSDPPPFRQPIDLGAYNEGPTPTKAPAIEAPVAAAAPIETTPQVTQAPQRTKLDEQVATMAAAPVAIPDTLAAIVQSLRSYEVGGLTETKPTDVAMNTHVATMKHTVPLDQQATGANMDRGPGE